MTTTGPEFSSESLEDQIDSLADDIVDRNNGRKTYTQALIEAREKLAGSSTQSTSGPAPTSRRDRVLAQRKAIEERVDNLADTDAARWGEDTTIQAGPPMTPEERKRLVESSHAAAIAIDALDKSDNNPAYSIALNIAAHDREQRSV